MKNMDVLEDIRWFNYSYIVTSEKCFEINSITVMLERRLKMNYICKEDKLTS